MMSAQQPALSTTVKVSPKTWPQRIGGLTQSFSFSSARAAMSSLKVCFPALASKAPGLEIRICVPILIGCGAAEAVTRGL
jgi:hypothetical protein